MPDHSIPDYSEAISKGVYNWLDAHKDEVLDILSHAAQAGIADAVDRMSYGAMEAIGRFLDKNSDDLKTGIAMAIATSWSARQHPVPTIPGGKK